MFAYTSVFAIMRGERPKKPLDAESLGLSDTLWWLVQSCWSESSSDRPTSCQLLTYLSLAALSWVPPQVYPAVMIDADEETDSSSSGLLGMLPESSMRETPDH